MNADTGQTEKVKKSYELVPTSPAASRMSGSCNCDGRWSYSCCFVGCCLQDLFSIACSILVYLPSSFCSIRFVSVHVMHTYRNIDTTAAWKKLRFILSVRFDFSMTDSIKKSKALGSSMVDVKASR